MGILDQWLPASELNTDTMRDMPATEAPLKKPTASAFADVSDLWRLNMPRGGWEYKAFFAPAQHHPPYLMLVPWGKRIKAASASRSPTPAPNTSTSNISSLTLATSGYC